MLKRLYIAVSQFKIRTDESGQDMVEYALLGAFVAVAAGATIPPIADNISVIFSKLVSITEQAP